MLVTGEIAHEIHHAVDTEVVTVLRIVAGICRDDRFLFVQRHLTHTVNRKIDILVSISHTVLCALQHHTATKHATEVCTLNSVQQTTCIDGAKTISLKIFRKITHIPIITHQFQIIILIYRLVRRLIIFRSQ